MKLADWTKNNKSSVLQHMLKECAADDVISFALGHLVELEMPEDIDKKKYGFWRLETLPIIPEKFGLKPIEAKGQKFDPNFHQAVATTPTDEVEENTILEEMRKGYLLNGRLLRPAMVNVATKG